MWCFGMVLTVLAGLPPDGAAQLEKVERLLPALQRMAVDPELVQAVREQNARGAALASIRADDDAWLSTPAMTPFKQRVLEAACSRVLARHREAVGRRKVAEAFVMDRQGALVGATRRTSDYWQGDEDKFQVPFKQGRVLTEHPFFDESSQAYVIQVSLPVRDGGRVIGAVTIGLSLLDL
ncbi:PDC sensor domain-containing protein [Corallococcus terminator]